MAVKLTEGAISKLSSGQWKATDVQPVLQVLDIRRVQTQTSAAGGGGGGENKERYRISLSDGAFHQQGMLATQRNELVRSQQLKNGSVVQLTEYVCNTIRDKMIIIIIDLDVILEMCDVIGDAKPYTLKPVLENPPMARPAAPTQSFMNQPATTIGNPQPQASIGSSFAGSVPRPNFSSGSSIHTPQQEHTASFNPYGNSSANNPEAGRYNSTHAPSAHLRTESVAAVSRPPANSYMRPVQSAYNQPPSMYTNRGPIARNEAPPRIIPIAALNPYQGRWTIKARVTAKTDLRRFNNAKGEGKIFSFDLLDSDGGEIKVTCFNAVADQFYNQVEAGKVYYISKGSLKPAQKAFNHLKNDQEITLEATSTIQPCFEDDTSIPHQQFHFRPIAEIEGMDTNSVLDIIGVVSSINPSTTIMRKNGTETQKRTLHLKDMSGRSVEVTLWGNFCNAEGQTLQNMCDSGVFPVLAVKSIRVNEFNGKSLSTILTSQLLVEPDFPEARKLKAWFDNIGRNTPSVSISRETIARTDVRKNISQIKDEKLGTSEKPDWITVKATIWHMKVENFCYTACPIMIGDRQCNKKVTNNGDGKWRCDRCDQTVDQCDYRYILSLQIQDHTCLTWITAFQEAGEEIMGVPAKDLYFMKHEEQDDERFTEIVRNVLFAQFNFKLKVKEETYSDEQRVKCTVVKAERIKFSSDTSYFLDLLKKEDPSSLAPKSEIPISDSRLNPQFGNVGLSAPPANYVASASGLPTSQMGSYGNQYGGSRVPMSGYSGQSCNSCGGLGHNSTNCPSGVNTQVYASGGRSNSSVPLGGGNSGASGDCYKCHQPGHWARDCPGASNVSSAYGSGNVAPGRYGSASKQYVGSY